MDGYMREQMKKLQVEIQQANKKMEVVNLIASGCADINEISKQTQLPINLINDIYRKMKAGTFNKDCDVFPETPDF